MEAAETLDHQPVDSFHQENPLVAGIGKEELRERVEA